MALGGSLVVAVGRAAKTGLLSRNAWAGIRTPATVASSEAWYAAHEAGGKWISIGGWIITVGGIILLLVRPEGDTAARILVVTAALGGGAVLYAGFLGNRAAAAVRDRDGR